MTAMWASGRWAVKRSLVAVFASAAAVLVAGCQRDEAGASSMPTPALVRVAEPEFVDSLGWSPSGRVVAAASGLSEVLASGRLRPLRRFGQVDTAAVSPSGARVATWSCRLGGCRVAFWTWRGRLLARSGPLPINPYENPQLIWSPHDQRLVVRLGQRRNDVRVLEARTGRQVAAIDGPSGYLDRQLWAPDQRRLALPTRGGVVLVDVLSGQRRRLSTGGATFGGFAWAPSGRLLAAHAPGGVLLLDVKSRTRRLIAAPHVSQLSWAPSADRLAFFSSLNKDHQPLSISLLETSTSSAPMLAGSFADNDGAGSHLTWSPDGTKIAFSPGGPI